MKQFGVILIQTSVNLQVYTNLQSLNVCLSFQGTVNIIEKLSEDHAIEVQIWTDELLKEIKIPTQEVSTPHCSVFMGMD